MAAIWVYITAGAGKGSGFALLGGSSVWVFLRQSLPSCTFHLNFFTRKTMEVWIIVLTGLKARITGLIHRKHSSLAVLSDAFYICSINIHVPHSGELPPPHLFGFIGF